MSAPKEYRGPRWLKLDVQDVRTPESRFLIGEGGASGWAAYGRWVALRQLLMDTDEGMLDLSDRREAGAIARELDTTAKSLFSLLDDVASRGGIDADEWGRRMVVCPDVSAQHESYRSRAESMAAARRKRGGQSV